MADVSSSAAAIEQRRSLRRHRTFATALLIVMGIGYLLALRSGLRRSYRDRECAYQLAGLRCIRFNESEA